MAALVVLTLVPALAYWQALLGLLVLAGFFAFALLKHNRGLCEHCAAALPLDAPAVAGRYGTRFRIVHLFEHKALAVGYLAAVVAASFLYEHPAGKFGWAAAQASLGYLLIVYVTHQRLQPWCPACRAGGEEQVTPSTPAPVSTSA